MQRTRRDTQGTNKKKSQRYVKLNGTMNGANAASATPYRAPASKMESIVLFESLSD